MTRRIAVMLLVAWFFSLTVRGERALAVQPGKSQMPNVVLFFIDDMGYADIGSFNQDKTTMGYSTPNLDRMADEGLLFTQLYATGTRTVRGLEALSLSVPPMSLTSASAAPVSQRAPTMLAAGPVRRDYDLGTDIPQLLVRFLGGH